MTTPTTHIAYDTTTEGTLFVGSVLGSSHRTDEGSYDLYAFAYEDTESEADGA
jgi:hypothetical protein